MYCRLYIRYILVLSVPSQKNHANDTHDEKVAFGLLTQLILEVKSKDEIKEVLKFCVTVGLPFTLNEIGVDVANDLVMKEIAKRTLAKGEYSHSGYDDG